MAISNATISSVSVVETQGSSGAAGTLITTAELYVTPDDGYTISKEDITVGTLPTGISTVTLTNTGTPYSISNKVKVTATLTPSYAMPSADTTLSIPLTGDAYLGVKDYIGYHFKIRSDRTLKNLFTEASTATGSDVFGNLNTVTLEQTGSKTVASFNGFVERNTTTVVGQYTITVKDGFHFDVMPALENTVLNTRVGFFGKLFLRPKSQVLNSENLHTSVVYDVVYSNTTLVEEASCIDTTLRVSVKQNISTNLFVSHMKPGSKLVNSAGETRKMYIYGNPGAKFSLSITSDTGVNIKKLTDVEIPNAYRNTVSGKGSTGSYECIVEFPATVSNVDWNIVLSSSTNELLSMVPTTIETYVLNQYTPSTVSITNSATNSNIIRTGAASIVYTAKADTDVEDLYFNKKTTGEYGGVKFTTPIYWTLTNSVGQTYSITKANPVLSDFTNVDSKTNGGTVVRAPSPFTVTGGGTSTAVIKGVLEISHIGKDDVAFNMNLDNIVTLS